MANLLKILIAFIFVSQMAQSGSECSMQAFFRVYENKYLANHGIEKKKADSELECSLYCLRHGSCASINYKTSGIGKGRCELNRKKTQETSHVDDEKNPEFNHLVLIPVRYLFYSSIKWVYAFLVSFNEHLLRYVYLYTNIKSRKIQIWVLMPEILAHTQRKADWLSWRRRYRSKRQKVFLSILKYRPKAVFIPHWMRICSKTLPRCSLVLLDMLHGFLKYIQLQQLYALRGKKRVSQSFQIAISKFKNRNFSTVKISVIYAPRRFA